MRKPIDGVSQIIQLGAVWPVNGVAFGPCLHSGSDGGKLIVWDCRRESRGTEVHRGQPLDERRALVLVAPDWAPDLSALFTTIEGNGWKITECESRADDVASRQLTMNGFAIDAKLQDQHCVSTGLLLTKWREIEAGRVFAAWLSTAHDFLSGAIGSAELEYEAWLHE